MKFSKVGFEFDGVEFPWEKADVFVNSLGLGDVMRALADLGTASRASDAHDALLGALQYQMGAINAPKLEIEEPSKLPTNPQPIVAKKRGRPRRG